LANAYMNIPQTKDYPHEAVMAGLGELGYENVIAVKGLPETRPTDLLVTWTLWRNTGRRYLADAHTRSGGTVLCMENGWCRIPSGESHFQLARRVGEDAGINGWGVADPGTDISRFRSWGIDLEPWSTEGEYDLVITQRGVKPKDTDITHGPRWANVIYDKLRASSDRPIFWRTPPGSKRPCLPTGGRNPERIIDSDVETLSESITGPPCMWSHKP